MTRGQLFHGSVGRTGHNGSYGPQVTLVSCSIGRQVDHQIRMAHTVHRSHGLQKK